VALAARRAGDVRAPHGEHLHRQGMGRWHRVAFDLQSAQAGCAAMDAHGEAYNDYYIAQLTELLSNYGKIVEVWFDGANGEGPNGRKQAYDWPRIHATVRRLQPDAIMFSDAGPDVRWIGDEKGMAGETCWSSVDPASVPYPGYDRPWVGDLLAHGD